MDLHEVAKIIAGPGGGGPGLRLRLGTVTAVAGDGTFSATIAGSAVVVSGIRAFDSVSPAVGKGIWLAVQGADVFGIGHIGAPAGGVPSGLIAMWSGTVANIPAGWALCNGSGGTPDLRDKFVVGSSAATGTPTSTVGGAAAATGGAAAGTSTSAGSHQHTDPATGGYVLQVADIPSHRHNIIPALQRADSAGSTNTQQGTSSGRYLAANNTTAIDFTGGSGSHAHPSGGLTDAQGAHTHSTPTLPPWYALAFIMKL
jgi:microcystin-dependent protein